MTEDQENYLDGLRAEVKQIFDDTNLEDGEHLWDNYQRVTGYLMRLSQMHNDIVELEISGNDWPEIKKFRTLIVDHAIDRLEKVAVFESRKITAKQVEWDMEKR